MWRAVRRGDTRGCVGRWFAGRWRTRPPNDCRSQRIRERQSFQGPWQGPWGGEQ